MPMYKENIQTILCTSTGSYFKMYLRIKWASLIAQLIKNLPAVQETPVQFLGQEDLLEKGPTPVFLGFPVFQLVKNLPACGRPGFDP